MMQKTLSLILAFIAVFLLGIMVLLNPSSSSDFVERTIEKKSRD